MNNRTFITGDVHGCVGKLHRFYQWHKSELCKDSVMVIAGDWGFIFTPDEKEQRQENMLKEILDGFDITFFVVLGNHENYDRIEKLPTKQMFGNTVRYEPEFENIVYAVNGNYYTINDKLFWVMGGAFSPDAYKRTPKLDWWAQEVPDKETLDACLENFQNGDVASIDYVVTHTCPLNLQPYNKYTSAVWVKQMTDIEINLDIENMLQKVYDHLKQHNNKFEWYCGHFHLDQQREIRFLYNDVVELKGGTQ